MLHYTWAVNLMVYMNRPTILFKKLVNFYRNWTHTYARIYAHTRTRWHTPTHKTC